jgi:hypothetical protein
VDYRPDVNAATYDVDYLEIVNVVCDKYGESLTAANTKVMAPTTLAEAAKTWDSDLWLEAAAKEYAAFLAKPVMSVEDYHPGLQLADTRYVFTYKLHPDGTIKDRKVRIVVKGYTQRHGIGYFEVWAPTGSLTAYRILLTYAAEHDFDVEALDIKCAFLNGKLEEPIFVNPPPGIDPGKIWRLLCAVHGLKQAARRWHLEFKKVLADLGYAASAFDPALFIRSAGSDGSAKVLIFTHLDNTAGTSPMGEIARDYQVILAKFEGRLLGELHGQIFLGIRHRRDRQQRTISISQPQLIRAMRERTGSSGAVQIVSTPLVPHVQLSGNSQRDISRALVEFPALIGLFLYLACASRPDIAFAAGALARFMSTPNPELLDHARHTCRYLCGTEELELMLGGSAALDASPPVLSAWSDSDFAGCPTTARSVAGIAVFYRGSLVLWRSVKLGTIVKSATSAEYVAASLTSD